MNICMLSGALDPLLPQPIGAIEPYVYDLSIALSKRNVVNLFGYGQGWTNGPNCEVKAFLGYSKILPLFTGLFGRNLGLSLAFNLNAFLPVSAICKKNSVDILHIHTPYNAIMASALKLSFGIPFVCSLHNELRITYPLHLCDKILANSKFIRQSLIKNCGVAPERIEVLSIAVDVNSLKMTRDQLSFKRILGLENYRVILFVGRKVSYKGPQIVIEALPNIIKCSSSKIMAVFIGPDYSFSENTTSFTKYLLKLAKKLKVEENVLFLSYICDSKLMQYYAAADVVVFPSTWQEPFGKTIIEAMSFEKPVIATHVGGIPEIVTDSVNGLLIPPSDPEVLADSINQLLENNALSKELGENGRKTVVENYSFEKIAFDCEKIYKKIVRQ